MRTAIIERDTRDILVVDPPTRDGKPILPGGIDCEVVELSDSDGAQIGLFNARYSVDLAGRLIVTPVPVVPPEPSPREVLRAEMEAATTLVAVKAALVKWAKAQP